MSAATARPNYTGKLKPEERREFHFRGARFFTRNLGAVNPMTKDFVWFAVGHWTHDRAYPGQAFSDLLGAVAARFDLWGELNLSVPLLRTKEQQAALEALEREINEAWSQQFGGEKKQ